MFLASTARCVRLLYRGAALGRSMSQYLISRLEYAPNVRIQTSCEICELHGEERLEKVTILTGGEETETIATRTVFVMIGADPCTDWLRGALELDAHGFVVTGVADDGVAAKDRSSSRRSTSTWPRAVQVRSEPRARAT